MSKHKLLKIVLTGGPCAGKTTILDFLKEELSIRGYRVLLVSETATQLHDMGVDLLTTEPILLQTNLIKLQLIKETIAREVAHSLMEYGMLPIILCDRGPMDSLAYVSEHDFSTAIKNLGYKEFDLLHRYDAVLHLVTAADGAEQFYNLDNNGARSESINRARLLDHLTSSAWVGTPHLRIFDNHKKSFEVKKRNVLAEVCNLLGVPEPLEVERKWILNKEETEEFLKNPPLKVSSVQIVQLYLNDGSRVRCRSTADGLLHYTHTVKTVVSATVSTEVEHVISHKEFLEYAQHQDIKLKEIVKTRYMFLWGGRYWELDRFKYGSMIYFMLETEFLSKEAADESIPLPPYFSVITEVTNNAAFKNKNIALNGFPSQPTA